MILKAVLIIVSFGLGACFGIAIENKSLILSVLTVIGTVGAVVWAVARDTIMKYFNRPKLDLDFYEADPPYLRYVPPDQRGQPHQHVLTLYIHNSGRSVAELCQPLITKMWFKKEDHKSWICPKGWVPLPLDWVFESQLQQRYANERNIVPEKPYLFNLCTFSDNNALVLTAPIKSRSQPSIFSLQTTYCIELTVFSTNAKAKKKYLHIEWKGPFEMKLPLFDKNVKIYETKRPPDSFNYEKVDDHQSHIGTYHCSFSRQLIATAEEPVGGNRNEQENPGSLQ